MQIRLACVEEAHFLSELAYRSKGHWNYGSEYMEAARKDLSISPAEISSDIIFVLEIEQNIQGFYELKRYSQDECELLWLFIDPNAIGGGYGKELWLHAVKTAQTEGYKQMRIKSDPYAEGFYVKQGAIRVGEIPSTVQPDLMFPLLHFSLVSNHLQDA